MPVHTPNPLIFARIVYTAIHSSTLFYSIRQKKNNRGRFPVAPSCEHHRLHRTTQMQFSVCVCWVLWLSPARAENSKCECGAAFTATPSTSLTGIFHFSPLRSIVSPNNLSVSWSRHVTMTLHRDPVFENALIFASSTFERKWVGAFGVSFYHILNRK